MIGGIFPDRLLNLYNHFFDDDDDDNGDNNNYYFNGDND
jgi:hypothetical protein